MQNASVTSRGAVNYFAEIRRFPMLKAEEEYMLAARWRERGDGSAAHRLLTSHLRLVAKIAIGYRGYGLPTSDLISEGNIGLMQAIKRFDPDKRIRFSTYASLVDQGGDPKLHSALVVAREDGHDRQSEEVIFQFAKAKRRVFGAPGRRFAARSGNPHCQ